ncbi:MAG: hypothetical protein K1X44_06710 [Alphaproteobacteria bacterium]|nr:hypothetical protein [Alphaproteobacteria bacterium]
MIGNHIEKIQKTLKPYLSDYNLYLGGSLARKEPSIEKRSSNYITLKSDVDLVIVGTHPPTYDLKTLEQLLQHKYPNFRDTVIFLKKDALPFLNFSLAHDFFVEMEHPIHESFAIQIPNYINLTTQHMLAVVIHQIIGVLFPNAKTDCKKGVEIKDLTTWHRDPTYQKIKLFLEIMRMLSVHKKGTRGATYYEAYQLRHEPIITNVIEPEIFISFLKAREIWCNTYPNDNINLPNILQKALKEITGEDLLINILENIQKKFYPTENLLDIFPLAILTAFLIQSVSNQEQQIIGDFYFNIIKNLPIFYSNQSHIEFTQSNILELLKNLRAKFITAWWEKVSFINN